MANLPPPAAVRPPASAATPQAAVASSKRFGVSSGRKVGAQRVLLYGPGGVGKSALAALAPNPVFLDLEHGSDQFDVARASGIESFADVREWLQGDESDPFASVILDTSTKLEELGLGHMIATIPHEKPGVKITSIESYGFGKGYRHLYDLMSLVLQDCDRLIRKGKNVILIAHSCTNEAPNPTGDNWLRYEPRLQHPKKENSTRERTIGWADHVLFIGYDVASNEGKGIGSGTRTIYTQELPAHLAKTRGPFDVKDKVPFSLPYPKGDSTIWSLILGGAK